MTITKEIGKIKSVRFGKGGYQDAMFGISFGLGSDKTSWGVVDFRGGWGLELKADSRTQWEEADRNAVFAETMRFINELLIKAKVDDISKLVGIPIEATFGDGMLKSWRVLEEAI